MADFTKETETTVLINGPFGTDNNSANYESTSCADNDATCDEETAELEQAEEFTGFSSAPNFVWIEAALMLNVFLSGFDGTVTASTYTTIGNEFDAAHLASWITTSYLITSTAFQPLYGSFSDVIGRRKCCFFASVSFAFGCIGCSVATNIITLNLMRAITGIGGGGLITLATIINSDVISPRKRGLFQAFQNLLFGFGAVCGASFGGTIASFFGWRWCFIIQVIPSLLSAAIGYKFVRNQPGFDEAHSQLTSSILERIDYKGSVVLVTALTSQLFVLTLGGNELSWSDYRLIALGFSGIGLLVLFVYIELNTKANPIIPVRRFKSLFTVLLLGQNFLLGLSAYAYLFALPLLFQIVLGDTPSRAGLRLAIPSLSTPIGGIITGVVMNKYGILKGLVYTGTFTMAVGNFLTLLVSPNTPSWLLDILLMPANIGQGMAYPSSLFTFIFAYGAAHQATSTSTIYLSRSIGGVFGVSSVSAIVQAYLKFKVTKDLKALPELSKHDIHKIVSAISRSTDAIYTYPDTIKQIILFDYERAIRLAQLFSSLCCATAFILCLLRDITRSKPANTSV
ncbi:major facilitator superfamily domain-containing protein [Scheffersomyces xylosifermentans]|uniref:major facilitator superfamily domain-containing protein n=1 Tax=Scheffersomyces xylosifermentans TaxID=1304137 RepID=UPI00315E02DC